MTPQLLLLGVSHHQAGQFDQAERCYQELLVEAPQIPDARHLLGLIRAARGDLPGGIELIRQAAMLAPDLSAALYLNLGHQCQRASRFAAATASYRHALVLDPGLPGVAEQLDSTFRQAVAYEWQEAPLDGDTVVIYQHNAGLGDNLLYSTLPELFARQGKTVYLSDMNRMRNPGIYDLVWKSNPYVRGISTAPPLAGMSQVFRRFTDFRHIANWLTRIEVLHGFPPTFDLPRVYYRPQPHPALSGRVLIDTNSQTIHYPEEDLKKFVTTICDKYSYAPGELTQLTFSDPKISEQNSRDDKVPSHRISSIFELCDAIHSARAFITVHSGGNSLAAALKGEAARPAIHCAVDVAHFNEKCYIWRNVDYSIVASRPEAGGSGP